ncbi:MAG: lipoate--protein ligase family protein [Candidatus Aenigmarchaeota archaeon]|nr:lipoate--protein ligase family protein [Candidatus Aenigmarchaeota archaeon]
MFDYEYYGSGLYSAAVNMALEEYFLRAPRRATFRLYSFPKDSAILGYAQATDALRKRDVDVMRRISGGSHVQAGPNILAYSVVVPRDGTFRTYEDMRAYYAEKVALALESMGVENIDVDNKASTVNVDGRVIASHAMVWGVERALLHGLVIISPYDVDGMSERLYLGERRIGSGIYTEYAALKNMPVVSRLLDEVAPGRPEEERNEIIRRVVGEALLQQFTGGRYERRKIGDAIMSESMVLIRKKFGNDFWVNLKKPPFTRDEIDEIPGEELDGPLKSGLGYCMYSQVPDNKFKKMAVPEEK